MSPPTPAPWPLTLSRLQVPTGIPQNTNNETMGHATQRSSYCLQHRGSTKHYNLKEGGAFMHVYVCNDVVGVGLSLFFLTPPSPIRSC